jgi:uncharacterized coiled-coil DUF342 family protein
LSNEAKEHLEQIKRYDTLIQNKRSEKIHWLEIMDERTTNITSQMSGDRVQSSGSKQKMADTVDSCLDQVRKIERRIKELFEKMDAIIADIEQLPEDKSDILHKVYVQYKSLKEVAVIRGESYSTVTTNHGIALNMILDILNKRKAAADEEKNIETKATICN